MKLKRFTQVGIEALADAIRNMPLTEKKKEIVIVTIGQVCASFNPEFDWNKWEKLCKSYK